MGIKPEPIEYENGKQKIPQKLLNLMKARGMALPDGEKDPETKKGDEINPKSELGDKQKN